MTSLTGSFRRRLLGRSAETRHEPRARTEPVDTPHEEVAPVDIAPNDPLRAFMQSASGAVDVESLELDSPALAALKAAGVKLAVPLVSQGELIGVLNLGPRRSEQEYSSDDRKLLDNLAAQAAPALRVGQLVRQQQAEARTRERFEQELEVARLIQQNFLPKRLPELDGWQVAAYYRPAREVGGDFYGGMPLGLMTGMAYEEKETVLAPGDSLLLHSDGVVEAHDPNGEMFGFPRLKDAVARYPGGGELIDRVLTDLREHTGADAEQEDDITMVTLARSLSLIHI